AGHHGHAGVDAFELLVAPRIVEVDLAGRGLEGEQAAAAKGKAPAAIADRGELQRGVAGQLLADLVFDFTAELIKSDDARAVRLDAVELAGGEFVRFRRTAANHHDQEVAFDDRSAANAEEILNDAEFFVEVFLP